MNEYREGILLVLVGPSGSGKGTVLSKVLSSDTNTFLSVSATTREPREGEVDGVNYYFMKKEEFVRLREKEGFLEWAEYCENYYGTPKKAVMERLKDGENVILEIEVQGAKQVKKMYEKAVFVFIKPPTIEELRRRLIGRNTEDEETINKRLETAVQEYAFAKECDYIVINDDVHEAEKDLKAILRAEGVRQAKNKLK